MHNTEIKSYNSPARLAGVSREQNFDVQPDLYADEIQVTGLLLDDLRGGLYSKTVLAGDFLRLPLVPPWSRPKKPGLSFL